MESTREIKLKFRRRPGSLALVETKHEHNIHTYKFFIASILHFILYFRMGIGTYIKQAVFKWEEIKTRELQGRGDRKEKEKKWN